MRMKNIQQRHWCAGDLVSVIATTLQAAADLVLKWYSRLTSYPLVFSLWCSFAGMFKVIVQRLVGLVMAKPGPVFLWFWFSTLEPKPKPIGLVMTVKKTKPNQPITSIARIRTEKIRITTSIHDFSKLRIIPAFHPHNQPHRYHAPDFTDFEWFCCQWPLLASQNLNTETANQVIASSSKSLGSLTFSSPNFFNSSMIFYYAFL